MNIQTKTTNLVLIKKSTNVGDCDQIDGVAHATSEYFKLANKPLSITELEIDKFKPNELPYNSIIIAAGSEGINSLLYEKKSDKTSLTVFLTHQWYPDIEKLIKREEGFVGIDIIAISSHVITAEIVNKFKNSLTTLIVTTGVCHNVQLQDVIKEYNLFKSEFPQTNKRVGIVLAGDAPDSENKWFFFTESEATRLANYLADDLLKEENSGAHLFITNGPRTGKFKNETAKEDLNVHRNGELDLVTKKFVDTLLERGFRNFNLYDFQFGKPSKFKAILGALEENDGESKIFMPGESISMISQTLDVLKKTSMIIYMNAAMNPTHKGFVEEVYQTGKAQVLDEDNQLRIKSMSEEKTKKESRYTPAREILAKEIIEKAENNSI